MNKRYIMMALASMLAMGTTSGAQAALIDGYAEYYASGNYHRDANYPSYRTSGRDATSVNYRSADFGNVLTYGPTDSMSYSSGYADAARSKLGVKTWVESMPGNNYHSDAYMETAIRNTFTVSPGTSGLAAGDTTILNITFRLDGTLSVSAPAWPNTGTGWAEMNGGFTIVDLDGSICNEGCYNPEVAWFGASAQAEAYEVNANYWGYSYSAYWEEYWQMASNTTARQNHDDEHSVEQHVGGSMTHFFDTGFQTISFEVVIGHTLRLDVDLSTFSQANRDGRASADFSNTFGYGVLPTVDGMQINWGIPLQPDPVPVPATILLLGTGITGVIGARLKRKKTAWGAV